MTTIKQTLIKARDLLIEKGWIKGRSQQNGSFCALGALGYVNELGPKDGIEVVRILRSQCPIKINGRRDIIAFNDHPNTTKADIIGLFDAAIDSIKD